MSWMIYGANGYSGEQIAREAKQRGLTPILAGRSKSKIAPLAGELGLEHRVFSLDDAAAVAEGLHGVGLVVHCAGPFSATSAPMIEACLAAKAHYLDITGEIPVFEHARAQDDRARQAGIVICPGVGFDVVPTDCVAAAVKAALPDATHLALGFDSESPMSPGTAKTTVESIGMGLYVRENGTLKTVPLSSRVRDVDFGKGTVQGVAISWGDVSTAYHTTGISNIETYIKATPELLKLGGLMKWLGWLIRMGWVQHLIKKNIEKKVTGPDETLRAKQQTHVWGEGRNARGDVKTARVVTDNVYSVTFTAAVTVAEHLLNTQAQPGYHTPSTLMGQGLVEQLPGSGQITVS